MQSAPPPCTASASLATQPAQSSYSVAVTYYDRTGTTLSCASVQSGTLTPAQAEIVSTGTSNAAVSVKETMHALVNLTPTTPFGVAAIFSQQALTINNQTTINGYGANNANVMTSGSFTCANNEYFSGNVYAGVNIIASNQCASAGDWWAGGSVTDTGQGTISGNVYANGGNISMGNNATVAKNATSSKSISPLPCGPAYHIKGTCSANANPGPPPIPTFPVLDWNPGAWTSEGYTLINDTGNCTKLYTDLASLATATTSTAIYTDCNVDWGKQNSWSFNTNVAVVSTGGMDTANQVTIQSSTSTQHNFYLMVPFHVFGTAVNTTCGSYPDGVGNITFKNQTTISLATFMYTPCGAKVTNKAAFSGQIFVGGQGEIDNNFTMNFLPFSVPGAVTTGYAVALEYKRQP